MQQQQQNTNDPNDPNETAPTPTDLTPTDHVLSEVYVERERQLTDLGWTREHDADHDAAEWVALLARILGRAADAALNVRECEGHRWTELAHSYRLEWRKRMIRLATTAVAAVEALDRAEGRS